MIFPTAVREGARDRRGANSRTRLADAHGAGGSHLITPPPSFRAVRSSVWLSPRALMNRPELVLADEPTGNLDRASAAQVMGLIAEINRDEGTTFLISTHDEKDCRAVSAPDLLSVTGW